MPKVIQYKPTPGNHRPRVLAEKQIPKRIRPQLDEREWVVVTTAALFVWSTVAGLLLYVFSRR